VLLGAYTPTCLIKKNKVFLVWLKSLPYICKTIKHNPTTMKLTADKQSTKIVKTYLKKMNMLAIPCQFNGFGDCLVRFVSVSETDKWNWGKNKYVRVVNFEIMMKKDGERFSESRIPSLNSWGRNSRQRFFKNRKYMAQMYINQMLTNTNIPLFLDMASITKNSNSREICGNVTYKYID
jgi:hypothetical protein